jgi:TusA-related sulfurtransferase
MSETIIDARGQGCPMPLMLTQKALKDANTTSPFSVLLSSETARENVERYLTGKGIAYQVAGGEEIILKITK